ncbi:MAG: hypothetical protein ACYSU0_06270 [Planctomycetota bacterium]|jgi:hypothetical protein
MSVQIDITPEGDILWVRFSGVMERRPLERRAKELQEIGDACRANNCSGLLMDVRGVDLQIDWVDTYQAAFAFGKPLVRGVRIAALVDEHQRRPDGIFEKLVGLTGVALAVFVDEEKALAWLDRPAAPGPKAKPKRRAKRKSATKSRKR